MKYFLAFFILLVVSSGRAQNINNASTNGYWSQCNTWNFPATLYNSDQKEKKILPGIVVTQDLPEVFTKKITLLEASKVVLGDNKISFIGNTNETVCDNIDYIDNVVVNFNESILAYSLSGFIQGMARSKNIPPYNDPADDHPTNIEINYLQPKLTRQWDREKYQRSYDLSDRVHMILSDNWRYWRENYYHSTSDPNSGVGIATKYDFLPVDEQTVQAWVDNPPPPDTPGIKSLLIKGEDNYNNYLDDWFYWGTHDSNNNVSIKPGIVWECWNEPDWKFMRLSLPMWEESMDNYNIQNWPLKEDYFKIYKMFYNRIRNYPHINDNKKALVAGPSLAEYSEQKMRDFLEYCLREGLEVNVVTWHELNWRVEKPISSVMNNIENFRKNFMDNLRYKDLKMETIEINEIVGDYYKDNPAAVASYLGYLEQAKVDFAAKSCWPDMSKSQTWPGTTSPECTRCDSAYNPDIYPGLVCPAPNSPNETYSCDTCKSLVEPNFACEACNSNTFDHIFTKDDERTSNWWTYKFYAESVPHRVMSYNTQPRSVVIASKDVKIPSEPSTHYAQVLFGFSDLSTPSTSRIPDGAYKIRLNKISTITSLNPTAPLYIKIKELEDHGMIRNIPAAQDYQSLGEIDPQNIYQFNNYLLTSTGYGPYSLDADGGLTITIDNIKRENLYQLTISNTP